MVRAVLDYCLATEGLSNISEKELKRALASRLTTIHRTRNDPIRVSLKLFGGLISGEIADVCLFLKDTAARWVKEEEDAGIRDSYKYRYGYMMYHHEKKQLKLWKRLCPPFVEPVSDDIISFVDEHWETFDFAFSVSKF